MKNILILAAVLVFGALCTPALALLPAPANFTATVGADDVLFAWDPVDGATKYSVDIEALVTFDAAGVDASGNPIVETLTATVEVDYSAVASPLDVLQSTIFADVTAALEAQGYDVVDVTLIDAEAKVKALNPGKGNGRQNNPFSAPASFTLPPP